MKKIILFFALIFNSIYAFGQTVEFNRIAPLMPENYDITGDAILEELSNGELDLRLSSDFDTPSGPDVRIFLNNSVSISGALEIANLSDINHFSGAITFDVPGGVDIEDYDYIIFYCFQFSQLWASGEFGPVNNVDFTCENSGVFNANGGDLINICPDDNQSDVVIFENDLDEAAGNHYAYLITDEDEILQEVVLMDNYDFEGSTGTEQRVYGIHYNGTLMPEIGEHREETTASSCYTHSNDNDFITIIKDDCPICESSEVENANGNDVVNICPDDEIDDIITFDNSLNENDPDHYAYLITDINQIVEMVVYDNEYNFEGSSSNTQRVYGVHYDGTLNVQIGSHRDQTTASICHTHSDDATYITVNKDECVECEASEISHANGDNSIDICPSDGINDIIEFENSLGLDAGSSYAYLITDDNEIVEQLILENEFDFEGSSNFVQRVYGLSYDGNLNIALGEDRLETTASECATHSSAEEYILITKNACIEPVVCLESITFGPDSTYNIDICPDDNISDSIYLLNNILLPGDTSYAFLITDTSEILQAVVIDSIYNFEGSGNDIQRIYGLHYNGTLDAVIGEHRLMTSASECYTHSSADTFLTITKMACMSDFECRSSLTATTDWITMVDICPADGIADDIELRNSIFVRPGEHYAYLITDEDEVLQAISLDTMYNFEGSGFETQRVYGIHYDGVLNPVIGANRFETTASGCFTHSGGNLFLTINKTACTDEGECVESLTATTNWVTDLDICATDGIEDLVLLQNNISVPPGDTYAFLLTDENQILQEVVVDSFYNFEGTGEAEQRVYGISYFGALDAKIGEHRSNTTASICHVHSGDNLFLKINKTAACSTSTENIDVDRLVKVYPNPSSNGRINLEYIGEESIIKAAVYDINGRMISDVSNLSFFDIDQSGLYFLRLSFDNYTLTRKIIVR